MLAFLKWTKGEPISTYIQNLSVKQIKIQFVCWCLQVVEHTVKQDTTAVSSGHLKLYFERSWFTPSVVGVPFNKHSPLWCSLMLIYVFHHLSLYRTNTWQCLSAPEDTWKPQKQKFPLQFFGVGLKFNYTATKFNYKPINKQLA